MNEAYASIDTVQNAVNLFIYHLDYVDPGFGIIRPC